MELQACTTRSTQKTRVFLKSDYDDKKGTTTAEASAIELSNR